MAEFSVPMRVEFDGFATVEASSAAEAAEIAKGGNFEFDNSTAAVVNWEVTGKAKADD